MEVKGVQFDLWSDDIFKKLGSLFDGFLEILETTLTWSDASSIRIKVMVFNGLNTSFVFRFSSYSIPVMISQFNIIGGCFDQIHHKITVQKLEMVSVTLAADSLTNLQLNVEWTNIP